MAQLKSTVVLGDLRVTDALSATTVAATPVTTGVTIAGGDAVPILDSSDGNRLAGASITFDGSTAT